MFKNLDHGEMYKLCCLDINCVIEQFYRIVVFR